MKSFLTRVLVIRMTRTWRQQHSLTVLLALMVQEYLLSTYRDVSEEGRTQHVEMEQAQEPSRNAFRPRLT